MHADDLTRAYSSAERKRIPVPQTHRSEARIKLIHADAELYKVVFGFRFGPGSELVPHTHRCHAIAYTISRVAGEA